jgi:hypothetical protein
MYAEMRNLLSFFIFFFESNLLVKYVQIFNSITEKYEFLK